MLLGGKSNKQGIWKEKNTFTTKEYIINFKVRKQIYTKRLTDKGEVRRRRMYNV